MPNLLREFKSLVLTSFATTKTPSFNKLEDSHQVFVDNFAVVVVVVVVVIVVVVVVVIVIVVVIAVDIIVIASTLVAID